MKKSISAIGTRARTAVTVSKQPVDWPRVVTVGIDVGDHFSYYCAIDADGSVVAEGRIATMAGAIELELKGVARKTIAIEAGMHSPWLSRLLTKLGHEVIVANPRKLRLIYENRRKSDRVDAEYLARVARLDRKLLGAIEHRSELSQSHLAVIRSRDTLVRTRARLIPSRSLSHQVHRRTGSSVFSRCVPQASWRMHSHDVARCARAAGADHRAAERTDPCL